MILCIETSSTVCSVAVFEKQKLIALEETNEAKNHSTFIIPMIEKVMSNAGINFGELKAIAVSSGPGSYTGLRIGVSTAKGLCDAHDIPLIAVPTLEAMAQGFVRSHEILDGWICPMFDARRMEVYYWLGDVLGKTIDNVQPLVLDEKSFQSYLRDHKIYFIGNGAKKAALVLRESKAIFDPEFQPSACWLGTVADQKYLTRTFEDLAYFEPFYLKDSESHLKPAQYKS